MTFYQAMAASAALLAATMVPLAARAETPSAPVPAAPVPSAPAASVSFGGPVIPGVCMISREAVLANSKVGAYLAERLKQMQADAQAEIDLERKPLESQIAAFRAQAPKLPVDQARAKEKALADREHALQVKAELRTREIGHARQKAIEAISAQTRPVIAATYTQHGCGVLFDRNSVLGGNMTNDLTEQVIAGLDARLTQIPVQREPLAEGSR